MFYNIADEEIYCKKCKCALGYSIKQQEYLKALKQKMEVEVLNLKMMGMSLESQKLNYEMLVKKIKSKEYQNVCILTGAGISVSAGIPDFRSPGSGIYANLQKYNLQKPEDLFTLSFFLENPKVFYEFSKEFDLEGYHPTPTHFFIRLLDNQGQLTMNLT